MGSITPDTVRSLPKAELHLHLDSGFEVEDAVRLATENGVPLLKEPPDAMFEWEDLQDFLTFLDWVRCLPRNAEQVASLSYSVARRQGRSGVSYTDLMVSPIHWKNFDGPLEEFIAAVAAGLEEAERDGHPPVYLSISISRKHSRAEAHAVLDTMLAMQHPRVVALSIDGNEALVGRTGDRFAPVFKRARAAGLGIRAHAGESSGPEGVWDAIDLLKTQRVDHGVRSVEDPELVEELVERGIFLNVCPWSNVLMGLYPDRESHPIRTLVDAGARVTLNTDGSGFYRITLEDEYLTASEVYGWSTDVVRRLARTSVEASFCPDPLRAELLAAIDAFDFSS